MFSVVFPGQGSQIVGMGREFYEKFDFVKSLFNEADETLNYPISKLILDGPKEELDLTVNTQPAIFLISYTIFEVIKKETSFNLNEASFFAGHSLGEYSALACSGSLTFEQTIKLLQSRGRSMQTAVPKGQGGMIAILGAEIDKINEIIKNKKAIYNLTADKRQDKFEGSKLENYPLDKLPKFLIDNLNNYKQWMD